MKNILSQRKIYFWSALWEPGNLPSAPSFPPGAGIPHRNSVLLHGYSGVPDSTKGQSSACSALLCSALLSAVSRGVTVCQPLFWHNSYLVYHIFWNLERLFLCYSLKKYITMVVNTFRYLILLSTNFWHCSKLIIAVRFGPYHPRSSLWTTIFNAAYPTKQ